MGIKKHATNKKAGGRHTTLIEAATDVYDFVCKIPMVSSVVAGEIKINLPTAPHRVSLKELTGCLSVKVRGTKCIQELKVYSSSLNSVKDVIKMRYKIK